MMRSAASTLLFLGLLLGAGTAAAGPEHARLPWTRGGMAAGGWRVERVQEHPEFMRFDLATETTRTTVEVVAHQGPPGEWTSRHHRLQPGPGGQADETLMRALLSELRAWDDQRSAARLAAQGSGGGLRAFDGADLALLLANALLLLLVLLLVAGPLARRPGLLAWTMLALAGVAVAWWWIFVRHQAAHIPLSWITVLHEGPTSQNVEFLYGRNRHTGPNHTLLTWLFADEGRFGLRDMVRLNGFLAVVNAALLLALGHALLGRLLPSMLIVAVFVGNAAALHAASSELAAGTTSTLLLLGVAAVLALGDPAESSRLRRVGTLAALCLATVLMGLTRTESAGFGLLALSVLVVRLAWGDGQVEAWARRAWQAVRASGWPIRAGVLALAAATLPLMWLDGRIGWLIAGVHPLNPSLLAAVPLLWTLVPLAAVALVVLGLAHTLRRWRQTLLFGVAVVILFRVYFCASHRVFYEMLRYAAALLPAMAILAMLGWRELEAMADARAWRPRWRKIALGFLVLGLLLPPLPWLADGIWDRRPEALPPVGTLLAQPLDADQQAEVRFMLAATEAWPECVIATRTTREIERVEAPRSYDWWLFGKPLPAPLTRPAADVELGAWLAQRLPDAPCVLFFRGLDCHLVDASDCEALTTRRPMVQAKVLPSRPYSDPFEYGTVKPELELALFRLR